jgi:hypothetical protein
MANRSGREVNMSMILERSNAGNVGSNPVRGTDVCQLFSVLCCVCK